MKDFSRPCVLLWSGLSVAFLLAGCGPPAAPRYVASGTILFDDKPLLSPSGMPPGEMPVRVQLIPDGADPSKPADPQICTYDAATGTFKTAGPDGKGIEAGQYRVVVMHYGDDALNAKYGQGRTPLVVEVKGANSLEPSVLKLSLP